MAEKKRSRTRPRAASAHPHDARSRVPPRARPAQEHPGSNYCQFCHETRPCKADAERERVDGKQVVDTTSGLSYVVAEVGHLRDDIDVYARVKGRERPIVTRNLR